MRAGIARCGRSFQSPGGLAALLPRKQFGFHCSAPRAKYQVRMDPIAAVIRIKPRE